MPFIKTKIKDLVIFEPKVFGDDRGYFFESYNKKLFNDNGIDADFIQDNQSFSSYGTVRGLHFQKGEFAQAKLVRAVKGIVLDVAVDLRKDSETFGQYVAVELSEDNQRQLFVPRGFAHGFAVLSDTAIFAYKCDNLYNKESEGSIAYNDKDLNIDWRIKEGEEIVSQKDAEAPELKNMDYKF